jgi:hypothetical protein
MITVSAAVSMPAGPGLHSTFRLTGRIIGRGVKFFVAWFAALQPSRTADGIADAV